MASSPITSWQINGETMETVRDFIFLGSRAPGKPARSPKPFKNESRLAKLQHIHPPTPIASRALPARLTPARSGFPERRPRRPPPSGALLPRPAGAGWGRRPRAASRCSFPRRLCGCQIGAGEPSGPRGGRPQPSRRRGPGEGAARAARIARRGPSRRSPLTSANFWGPLGGSERTRARAPGSPRPGWASRRLVGAPGHSPSPGRGGPRPPRGPPGFRDNLSQLPASGGCESIAGGGGHGCPAAREESQLLLPLPGCLLHQLG